MTAIRDARPDDEAAWRGLWAQYLDFYETELADEVTATTWARIVGPDPAFFCRVAVNSEDTTVGFAIGIVHPASWTTAPVLYLEDLFVDPSARGGGVGRALIDDLVALCKARGWARLYWHTDTDNARARALYDSYQPADAVVRYRLYLDR
jgi:GNAT superfamily N-acetyltransferase